MNPHPRPPLSASGDGDGDGDGDPLLRPVGRMVRYPVSNTEALASASDAAAGAVHEVRAGAVRALRRVGWGLAGAAYACVVLAAAMAVAVAAGVWVVRAWVEEPLFVREALHLDYTKAHPSAEVRIAGGLRDGHTLSVSLLLLLPESDYNREIGVFQVIAEVMSTTGEIKATSSQPCMLRFRSSTVRLMRTLIMAVPLLMGVFSESQEICMNLLKYKERHPRTEVIQVRLMPKAGTRALPELYSAEIIMKSQLPWIKELIHNWKWTFYVWCSLYIYVVLVAIIVCCCKPVVFPMRSSGNLDQREEQSTEVVKDKQFSLNGNGSFSNKFSDRLKQWQKSRVHRRELMHHNFASSVSVGSSASCVTGKQTVDDAIESSEAVASESEYESC